MASLDARQIWAPPLAPPVPQHLQELSGLAAALYEARDDISRCLDQFLFGFETDYEKVVNDTTDAVHSGMAAVGFSSVAEALLGAPTERPPPHTQLQLLRAAGRPVEVSASALGDAESGAKLATSLMNSYTDITVVAMLLAMNVDAPDTFSDIKMRLALGSEEAAMRTVLGLLAAAQESLAWLASRDGDCQAFKYAIMAAFPALTAIASRMVDIQKTRFSKEEIRDGLVKLSFEAPIDFSALQNHYPSLGAVLGLFEPLLIRLRRPEDGAFFADVSLQEGVIRCSFHFCDGQMVWLVEPKVYLGPGCSVEPVRWDDSSSLVLNAEVECSLVPLGVSLAAVPFPVMKFRCELLRTGSLTTTCVEASVSQFENVASLAFDMDQFRKLLLQDFRFELSHVAPRPGSEEWTIQAYFHVAFPTSSVVKALTQWFRGFITGQVSRMDTFKALCHLSRAVSKDAAELMKGGS